MKSAGRQERLCGGCFEFGGECTATAAAFGSTTVQVEITFRPGALLIHSAQWLHSKKNAVRHSSENTMVPIEFVEYYGLNL